MKFAYKKHALCSGAVGKHRSGLLAATACVGLIAAASPAQAQNAGAPPPPVASAASNSNTSQTADIIVTAQKRAERLQNVPIAIIAVSPLALTQSRVSSSLDLSQVVSGLVSPTSISGNEALTPFIRGVGSAQSLPGFESSVAVYIDGVYSASQFANQVDLADIAQIEVLKGPQGTLYGRNATGGAISIVTKDPSDHPEGSIEASYGRFDQTVEKGYLSVPITSTLSASLSAVGRQGYNYGENLFLHVPYGGLNSITLYGKVLWKPVDALKIELTGGYTRKHGREFADTAVSPPGRQPLVADLIPGALYSNSPDYSYSDPNPDTHQRTESAALHIRYSFPSVDLVSISAYQKNRSDGLFDADGTNINFLTAYFVLPSREYTQELQLVSTNASKFQWIVGGFYINFNESHNPATYTGLAFAELPGGSETTRSFTTNQGESAYAEGTYEIFDGTKLTAGLRYSTEKKTLNGTIVDGDGDLLNASGALAKRFSKLTWRFSLDHQFSRDILGYASYNRGFKSGGYNDLDLAPVDSTGKPTYAQKPVDPEVLDAYETGLKTQFFDRRVTFNSSFYYYKYSKIQVQIVDLPNVILENAASATLYGLDGDLTIAPTAALRLHAGINLEHARYGNYPNASGFQITGNDGFGTQIVIPNGKGQRVLGAPDLTFNVGGSYKLPLGNAGSLTPAINYGYNSTYKIALGDGNYVNGFGILNATVTWQDRSDRYSIGVYGDNLTNVKTYGAYTNGIDYALATRHPLSYGVTVGAKF